MHACKDQTFSHKSQTQPSWVYQREDMRQTAEGPTVCLEGLECIINVNIMYYNVPLTQYFFPAHKTNNRYYYDIKHSDIIIIGNIVLYFTQQRLMVSFNETLYNKLLLWCAMLLLWDYNFLLILFYNIFYAFQCHTCMIMMCILVLCEGLIIRSDFNLKINHKYNVLVNLFALALSPDHSCEPQ